MKLKDVLAAKGRRVVKVSAKSSVADAIRTMHAEKVGAVMVPDAEGCPVGIFTERDVVRLHAGGEDRLATFPRQRRIRSSRLAFRKSCSIPAGYPLSFLRSVRRRTHNAPDGAHSASSYEVM